MRCNMADITMDNIKKAMEMLEKAEAKPTTITMSPAFRDKVIKMLNDKGIKTKGEDGNDYVLGARVIVEDMCEENVAYISESDGWCKP